MDKPRGGGSVELWAAQLAQHWMETGHEAAGTFHVGGHVPVHHGEHTRHASEIPFEGKGVPTGE
jgi:hypothetical protein